MGLGVEEERNDGCGLDAIRGGNYERSLQAQSERAQRLGQGEHDVEVRDREQILALSIEPALGGRGLTLRTVPIAAGVVGDRVRLGG